jgi:FMN phosphatase YigB (HAD superfamily)
MIGNEAQNDIVPANKIGMKTFWVTSDTHTETPADWRGSLADVVTLLENF